MFLLVENAKCYKNIQIKILILYFATYYNDTLSGFKIDIKAQIKIKCVHIDNKGFFKFITVLINTMKLCCVILLVINGMESIRIGR